MNFKKFLERWLYVLIKSLYTIFSWKSYQEFWNGKNFFENIKVPLNILLLSASLEIVHALLHLVKSSAVITFNQVFIRFLVIWGIVNNFYSVKGKTDDLLILVF